VAGLQSFLGELKRRKVYRVAVVYSVVGLGVVEAGSNLLPALGLPTWTVTLVAAMTLLGFPIAVGLAWAFDVTPEGVRREATDKPPQAAAGWLSFLATVAVVVLVLLFATRGREHVPAVGTREDAAERVPIAILPLESFSPEADDAAFADGIHEEILNQLAKVSGFRVTSRTSTLGFRENPPPTPRIAETLGVDYLVEGSVRRAGETVRITAQLIDPTSDEHLWSEAYDRRYTAADLFEVQTQIARSIASALRVRLLPEDERRLGETPTENTEAYELYLTGLHHVERLTQGGARQAIDYFERASAVDSTFAEPVAQLAYVWLIAAQGLGLAPPDVAFPRATAYAERAIRLNPDLPGAHAVRAMAAFLEYDPATAIRSADEALRLAPSDPFALQVRGFTLLLVEEEKEEAVELLDRAVELDPLSLSRQSARSQVLFFAGRREEALAEARTILERDPSFCGAFQMVQWVLAEAGRIEALIQTMRERASIGCSSAGVADEVQAAYASGGMDAYWAWAASQAAGGHAMRARAYSLGGQVDSAFAELERAFEGNEGTVMWLLTPWFEPLRGDPRFGDLARRVGLAP
jgi:adenylate cyclase